MSTRLLLCGSIALAFAWSSRAGAVEPSHTTASVRSEAGTPKVVYGGFATPRTKASLRPVEPSADSFIPNGPLDRTRTYFWDERYHRWDGSEWVVIDSSEVTSPSPSSSETGSR